LIKILLPLIFAVIITSIIGNQDAFAENKNYIGPSDGDWFVANSWDPAGVPAPSDDVTVGNPNLPDINSDVLVGPGGTLTIQNNNLDINAGTLANKGGTIIFGGGDDIDVNSGATFLNDCTGTLQIGDSAELNIFSGGTGINHGTITASGTGRIDVSIGGLFQNSGINGAPFDLPGGTIEQIASTCIVGGSLLPIDTTALMLAGLQSSAIWMLPVLAGAAGAGIAAFKLRKRI